MTDTQLIVVTLWTLFAILALAAVYAIESPLREANRHRESLIARIVSLTERL